MPEVDLTPLFSKIAAEGMPQFFDEPKVPITFNFDQGLAAPETFPLNELADIVRLVVDRDGPDAFEYFSPEGGLDDMLYGYVGLREQIAERILAQQGRDVGRRGIMLTNGSTHGLALMCRAYLNPGDAVIVEALSFPYGLRYMTNAGAQLQPIPIEADGMDVDAAERRIEELAAEGIKTKMIYTIPTFQLPTGTVMSMRKREQLVELAQRHNIILLDDAIYDDTRFDGEALPTLFSLDDSGLVIQSNSFTKTIAPGIRIGWLAGVEQAVLALAGAREDLGVSQFVCRVLAEYMASGAYDTHIADVAVVHRAKRDLLVRSLDEHCGKWISYEAPDGGVYVWVELSDEVDWAGVQRRVAEAGIYCRPGEIYTGDESGRQFLRIAFTHASDDELARGMAELGKALEASVLVT